MLFFGASLLMTAVVVLLLRIVKTIKVRGEAMQTYVPALLNYQGGNRHGRQTDGRALFGR